MINISGKCLIRLQLLFLVSIFDVNSFGRISKIYFNLKNYKKSENLLNFSNIKKKL